MKVSVDLTKVTGGSQYCELWDNRFQHVVMIGARGSMKSEYTALYKVWRLVTGNREDGGTFRRFREDNKRSTMEDVKTAIIRLQEAGITDFEKDWTWHMTDSYVLYKPTGQKIRFEGIKTSDKVRGWKTGRSDGYFGFLHFEELIQEGGEADLSYEQERKNYDSILRSLRRGSPEGQFKLAITSNPHVSNHWVYDEYIWPLIKDLDEEELIKTLKTKGIYKLYDPLFKGGQGLALIISNWRINPFISEEEKKDYLELEKKWPELARAISIGLPSAPTSLTFIKYKEMLKSRIINPSLMDNNSHTVLTSHLDPAENKAKTVCTMYFKKGRDTDMGWERPVGVLLFKHDNKKEDPMTMFEKADKIIMEHYRASLQFEQMNRGFSCIVDGHSRTFVEILEERKLHLMRNNNIDLRWLEFKLGEKPKEFEGLENRGALVKQIVLNGLEVCPKLYNELASEWHRLSYEGITPSKIEGNDATQTLEYFGIFWFNWFKKFNKMNIKERSD